MCLLADNDRIIIGHRLILWKGNDLARRADDHRDNKLTSEPRVKRRPQLRTSEQTVYGSSAAFHSRIALKASAPFVVRSYASAAIAIAFLSNVSLHVNRVTESSRRCAM